MKPPLRLTFAVFVMVLSTLLAAGSFLCLDLYLHKKYEKSFGLNIRGYRGPVLGKKLPDEKRVVVLGGSTAFGYGVLAADSFPAYLDKKLQALFQKQGWGRARVVNLAYNREGVYAALFNLQDYAYLDYDVILLYQGYNDLGRPNRFMYRQSSALFHLTGYFPIFPLIFKEKAMQIRTGGRLAAAYNQEAIVFQQKMPQRITATLLEKISHAAHSVEEWPEVSSGEWESNEVVAGVPSRWRHYLYYLFQAVDQTLRRGKSVVVVAPPHLTPAHREQQHLAADMLSKRFPGHPRLRYVDLGDALDINNPILSWDGMHLTAAGNERMAQLLLEPVVEILGGSHSKKKL